MRKATGMIIAIIMLCALLLPAGAEQLSAPDYVMEGFDGDSGSHDWETNLFFQRMQEETGISFEFRQARNLSDWTTRKEGIIQGENLPDVLFKAELTDDEIRKMSREGILIDLKPYLEEYAPDLWALLQEHPDYLTAITLPDGTVPTLPSISELATNNLIWINETWLKNVQMEMPKTAEELTEVLRAFRDRDPNRNGQADEIPLSVLGMWDLRFLAHAFGITDNDSYLSLRDGQIRSSLTEDANREFLAWLHQLWTENLLSHSSFSMADSMRQITDSKAAVTYGMFLAASPLSVVPSEAMGQYTTMIPLSFEGRQTYRELIGPAIRGTFALTRTCREPERMIAWVNRLYTEQGSILMQVGREGSEYEWTEDGTWEWIADLQTVAEDVLPNATLGDGGLAPGLVTRDFQSKFADQNTQKLISAMIQIQPYQILPVPAYLLSGEDAETAARLQAGIAAYAEQKMAEFVTGDTPLDDGHWQEFCRETEERGLPEMISLWQKYVTAQGKGDAE